MTLLLPKDNLIRDRKYLDWLRSQPCLLTGYSASENMAVDPMHIGTAGKGLKSGDDEAIPVVHYLHRNGHQAGEVSMLREHAPDWLIRDAFRAYAREMYRNWKNPACPPRPATPGGREMRIEPKDLDGMAAAIAADNTAMSKRKGEMDTAFVKRIVCAYINALPEAGEIYAALLRAVKGPAS